MSWEKINLGEIAEFKNGLNFSKDQYGPGVKYISVADFKDYFSAKIEGLAELKEDFISDSYFLKEGDILFVRSNGNKELVGRNLYIENAIEPITFSGFCIRARFTFKDVLPRFYAYLFNSKFFRNTLSNNAGGTNINNLNQGILSNLRIPKPPLTTQRRIASILSAYDDQIENNLKRIKLLEEKAVLSYRGIVKNELMSKKLPLCELATVTSSKRIFLSDYVDDGVPFYRSKEIIAKSNFESIENPLFIAEEKYLDIKEKYDVPSIGDLLITSVGTIGFIHLVNEDDGDFYFKDGNLIWIKNINQKNLSYFLFFKFRTKEFREMLNSVAIGSSQKALTIETVKKIEIELPNENILIDFNQEAKTIIKFIYNLQKQNTKLREARDILLPRLMSGEIEV